MSQRSLSWFRQALASLCLVTLGAPFGVAQTTSFTYQGKLTDAGNPANGAHDLQFRLFDALVSGNQVGPTIVREDVAVSGGIFTVTLDFGAAAFPGANRFLEIGVRPGASTGPFTTLAPLQPINSTPYAVQSLNATNATNTVNFSGSLAGEVTGTQSTTTIANNAVTTPKLADSSVNNAKIADVAGSKIIGSITTATIPGANVTGAVANAINATTAVNFSGALLGDVTGNQGTTTVGKLRNLPLPTPVLADDGKVLRYKNDGVNPASFELATVNGGGGTITGVTAGTGLSGGGTNGTVTVGIAAGGVSVAELATNAVTTAKLADGSVTNAKIADVAGSKITGSITTATIPGANVTSAVPNATSAINFSGTLAGDVTGTQSATTLADNAVTTVKLADGSVTNVKIADVAGSKLTGSITTATIPGANVTGAVANATNATTTVNFSGTLAGDVTGTQSATVVSAVAARAQATSPMG